ncbi:MAG: hypothetical protein ACOYK1_03150 [Vampirovibrionia bacterium]
MTIDLAKTPTSPARQPASKQVQQLSPIDNTVVPPKVEPKAPSDSSATKKALHSDILVPAEGGDELIYH